MNSISDRELLENRDRVEQLRFTASVVGELIASSRIKSNWCWAAMLRGK